MSGSDGGGIILFRDADGNRIANNESTKNAYGVLSVSDWSVFPSGNTIEGNQLSKNSVADAADYYPVCQNSWIDNTFKTADGNVGCIN